MTQFSNVQNIAKCRRVSDIFWREILFWRESMQCDTRPLSALSENTNLMNQHPNTNNNNNYCAEAQMVVTMSV
jgi:hypothetical protein